MGRAWLRKIVVSGLALMAACSGGESIRDDQSEAAGLQTEALTAVQQRVLGFEGTIGGTAGDWRALAGTAISSSTRIEGLKSMALSGSASPKAVSTSIASLGSVATSAKIGVSLPSSLGGQSWLGQLALRFDSPTAGVFSQFVGPVPFAGPLGTFREYSVPLPASLVTKLSTSSYTDLKITVELNVPSTSGAFLIDKLVLVSNNNGTGGTSGVGGSNSAGGGGNSGNGGNGGRTGGSGGGGAGAQAGGGTGGVGHSGSAGSAAGGATGGSGGSAGSGGASGGGSGGLTYEFAIKTPTGVSPRDVIVAGDGLVKINDRVNLLQEVGTGRSSASNMGGTQRAWFGPDAQVQNVWSKTGVELKNRAHVWGFIRSEQPIVREPDSVVDGAISTTAELDPANVTSWSVTFPSSSQGDIELLGGQTATPNSGTRFGAFFVRPNARLRLNPGIYYFDSLTIESGALLDLLNSTGAVQVYVRGPFRFRGSLTEAAAKSNTLFGIAGRPTAPADAFLEAPFRGIVVSPYGQTTLSTTAAGHIGSFFGQRVEVHQATTVKQRPFDPTTFCSGVQECGGLCPCVPEREPCTSPSQCTRGTTCPDKQNGWRFGLAAAARVCEPVGCTEFARELGCGGTDSPCGNSCTDDVPCTTSTDCPGSERCGIGNGRLLGSSFDNVCWNPICETDARSNNCGGTDALCGVCACIPSCEERLCGESRGDGCGGQCLGFCSEREAGCTSDLDCAAGTHCFEGEGARVGLPEGTNVCLPASCRSSSPVPGDCGGIDAACGICPACVKRCEARECGLDPVCGEPCGSECSTGSFCTDSGHCAAYAETPPISIPDGAGGSRVITPLEPQPTSGVGALDGHFAVSESGAPTYTIPIIVPPGRSGIEPSLRLVYDGSRSNGDLGMGWRLDGLSHITSCARSVALDGFIEPLDYSTSVLNNALCLDGKRLVQVGSSPTGIEYRTLLDSFARIHFVGDDSFQRTSFVVYAKDGRILTYGRNTDAVLATTTGAAHTWGLSRIEDRRGNFMTIAYQASPPSVSQPQDLQPTAITYTGFGTQAGNREVRFTYEPRPDVVSGFRPGGAPYVKEQRLTSIATYKGQQQGRTYNLGYDPDLQGLSQITSVTECATTSAGTACKQPTTFNYKRESGFEQSGSTAVKPGAWIDLNGDGRQDILHTDIVVTDTYKPLREVVGGIIEGAASYYGGPAGGAATALVYRGYLERQIWPGVDIKVSRTANFARNNPNSPYESLQVGVDGLVCQGLAPGFILDFNSDKKDDLIEVCSQIVFDGLLDFHFETNFGLALSKGDGDFQQLERLFQVVSTTDTRLRNPFTHDLNGDGFEDILYCYDDLLAYRLRVPGGSFVEERTTSSYGTLCSEMPFRLQLDVDGNGTLELIVNKGHTKDESERELAALFYGPAGPFWSPVGRTASLPLSDAIRVGDFNGDGLADILEIPRAWLPEIPPLPPLILGAQGAPVIWLNVGGRFEPRMPAGDSDVRVSPGMYVTDYDRDGRSDILYQSTEEFGSGPRVKRFSHSLDSAASTALTDTAAWTPIGGDANADGVLDLFVPVIQFDERLLDSFLRPLLEKHLDKAQQWVIYNGRGRTTHLLESVRDGLGNLIEVKYATDDPLDKTYTPGTGCYAQEECVKRMPILVSQHIERLGNWDHDPVHRWVTYEYSDARIDRAGNGWMGFAQRTIKERDRNEPETALERTLVIEYGKRSERLLLDPNSPSSYIYPYAGLATRQTLTSGQAYSDLAQEGWVARTTTTDIDWQVQQSASGRYFPYVSNRNTTMLDNGVPVLQKFQHFDVDGYGNVKLDRTTQGGDSLLVLSDFTPTPEQEANWLVSLQKTESVTSFRDGLSTRRQFRFDYDPTGLLQSVTRAPDQPAFRTTTTFTPDAFGNVAVMEVAAGGQERATAIGYDNDAVFPATVTNAKLHTTQLRYDEFNGGLVTLVDPNGIVTQQAYDGFGRLSVADGPEGQISLDYFSGSSRYVPGPPNSTGIFADEAFGVSVETGERRFEVMFDILGRQVSRSASGYGGAMVSEEMVYDRDRVILRTRPHLKTEPYDAMWEYEFDGWKRPTRMRTPEGAEYRQEYASAATLRSDLRAWLPPNGVEVIRNTDPDLRQNVRVFDGSGLPVRNIDGKNVATAAQTTDYFYGPFDQIQEIRDNLQNAVSINYYTYGQVGEQHDLNLGTRIYTYTPFDELQSSTDALNRTRTYAYDTLGRLESVLDQDGLTEWTYDGSGPNEVGRLVATHGPATARSPEGHRTIYAYEPPTATANRGLLKSVTQILDDQELTTSVDYDDFARPQVIHYPAAAGQAVRVEYTYTNGLLARVDDTSGPRKNLWEVLTTERGYRIKDETRGDGTTTTYAYQPKTDRIESIRALRGSDLVQDLTYLYNANGTVQQRHDHLADPFPEVFSYDELNRLTERRQRQSSGSERIESFAYDALGNLTQMPGVGSYTFLPNRPQLVATAGSYEFTHDANGNVESRSGPGGSQTFGYTAFDMPARITPAAGSSAPDVELEYDAFEGRAVKRATEPCAGSTCPSTTTYSTGDLYTRTVQVDGPASNVEHRYRVYAGASAVAEIVRNTSGAAVATWYPHTDALGSPNVLINDSGALFRQSFAPFGQPTSEIPVGETGSLMGFTGHDHDSEAGLINMKGRLYDPAIGRFLTADPIVQSPFWSQGLNRYAYVFNSPLNLTDPSGFSAIDDYFQGLNDAPPEQAIPGYIGTGLVAGLAGYAIYEGVSLSISSGASAASTTAASQSGGGDPSGAIGAGIVAIQRFSAALGPTQSTHPGVVPTRSLTSPGARQAALTQNRTASILVQEGGRALERLDRSGEYSELPVEDDGNYVAQRVPRRPRGAPIPGPGAAPVLRPLPRAERIPLPPVLRLFPKLGIQTTDHFRFRLQQRAGRGITEENALDAYLRGRLYYNHETNNYIRHSSRTGVSVATDRPAGGTAITVFEGNPSPDWQPLRWRPGL